MSKKITNPDVYGMLTGCMGACLTSIQHNAEQDGGMSMVVYERLRTVYDELLLLSEHLSMGKPLPRPGWAE